MRRERGKGARGHGAQSDRVLVQSLSRENSGGAKIPSPKLSLTCGPKSGWDSVQRGEGLGVIAAQNAASCAVLFSCIAALLGQLFLLHANFFSHWNFPVLFASLTALAHAFLFNFIPVHIPTMPSLSLNRRLAWVSVNALIVVCWLYSFFFTIYSPTIVSGAAWVVAVSLVNAPHLLQRRFLIEDTATCVLSSSATSSSLNVELQLPTKLSLLTQFLLPARESESFAADRETSSASTASVAVKLRGETTLCRTSLQRVSILSAISLLSLIYYCIIFPVCTSTTLRYSESTLIYSSWDVIVFAIMAFVNIVALALHVMWQQFRHSTWLLLRLLNRLSQRQSGTADRSYCTSIQRLMEWDMQWAGRLGIQHSVLTMFAVVCLVGTAGIGLIYGLSLGSWRFQVSALLLTFVSTSLLSISLFYLQLNLNACVANEVNSFYASPDDISHSIGAALDEGALRKDSVRYNDLALRFSKSSYWKSVHGSSCASR